MSLKELIQTMESFNPIERSIFIFNFEKLIKEILELRAQSKETPKRGRPVGYKKKKKSKRLGVKRGPYKKKKI
jgi:hypothetical protein